MATKRRNPFNGAGISGAGSMPRSLWARQLPLALFHGDKGMLTILKIAAAAIIGLAVLNPSFGPRAEDASCSCKADA